MKKDNLNNAGKIDPRGKRKTFQLRQYLRRRYRESRLRDRYRFRSSGERERRTRLSSRDLERAREGDLEASCPADDREAAERSRTGD